MHIPTASGEGVGVDVANDHLIRCMLEDSEKCVLSEKSVFQQRFVLKNMMAHLTSSLTRATLASSMLTPSQENKSDNGSDQPTKSDGIPGNESTNGYDRSALFSVYVLISILVNTREELYTTIISCRIPIVGPNQIRWKFIH